MYRGIYVNPGVTTLRYGNNIILQNISKHEFSHPRLYLAFMTVVSAANVIYLANFD